VKIKIKDREKDVEIGEEGRITILELPLKIKVAEGSFLHIGAAPSPLTEKKGAVFKVGRIPVVPATSFKGALRHQMELLFIEKIDKFVELFKVENEETLRPCIPSQEPSKAEEELSNIGKYRRKAQLGDKQISGCQISVDDARILVPEIDGNRVGICPVCYFMGAAGIMGFLRFSNFYPEGTGGVIDQTNIRIDRKTGTAAPRAKVDCEQVEPGTVFKGSVSVIISEPVLSMQGIQFGDARKINGEVIDKWLESWDESDKDKRVKTLIEEILIPAIENIKMLGGQKSRGAGKVNMEIV